MRIALLILSLGLAAQSLRADEGMWLPTQYENREEVMRELGLQADGAAFESASRAVVRFGQGCTASFVSAKGLLLTNYHCAYQAVAQHSSPERNIVETGYWAVGGVPELPVKGLSVEIDRVVRDVTDEVQKIVADGMSLYEAMRKVAARQAAEMPRYRWTVRDYRASTCFVLYGSEVFNDVRLVGVLPQSVAKFGGETDNYMWPRHNPDFALFRVYAAPDGTPASYAPENVPYATGNFLHVSQEGYDEGDFALSLGYPVRTTRSATSAEIRRTRDVVNGPIVAIRGRMLDALQQRMRADRAVNLAYYEEFNALANEYKNLLGMNEWIDRQGLVDRKRAFERDLVEWTRREKRFPGVERYLAAQERMLADSVESRAVNCMLEGFHRCSRMLNFVMAFGPGLETLRKGGVNTGMSRKDYLHNAAYYYGRMVPEVDREMTALGMELVRKELPADLLPSFYAEQVDSLYDGDIRRFVDTLYARSIFADSVRIRRWLDAPWCSYDEDPVVEVEHSIDEAFRRARARAAQKSYTSDRQAMQDYRAAQIAFLGGAYYPDADRTLRFSYGRVCGLDTRGFQTRFSEIAAKDDGVNPDYRRTERLRELGAEIRDGRACDTPLCFITNGDVTGGNSGSPMLDSRLRLIGLVCDCNWESMTRDYGYDPALHRVITVDIRSILMLIERYGGAGALVSEMTGAQ